ncbi:MAG TPA: polysaccharide biosynthesis/export family protein [Terriglobales bacterium]|nr:polysaccharide biosynthesis/export family protein [Terriglobales bacterium]
MIRAPRFPLSCLCAAALLCGLARAQVAQPPSAVQAVLPPAAAVPASYKIGVDDVLAMRVYGLAELTDPQMRVDADGTIHTPFGTTPVHVLDLTIPEARAAIAAELVADHLAIAPRVEVTVANPASHAIVVTGMVARPGVVQAIEPMRLLDVLTAAGGMSSSGGTEVVIVSHDAAGAAQERRLAASAVLSGLDTSTNPWLRGGEQVRVLPGGFAYIAGAVNSPGAFALDDSDPLTIRKLMAKAKGMTRVAKTGEAQLVHNVGSAHPVQVAINLPAILDGKSPDLRLTANDLLYVPESGVKRAGYTLGTYALSSLSLAFATLLVR